MLRNTVRQLVPNDIEGLGEAIEEDSIPVPVDHLPAVPKRVVILPRVVDGRVEPEAPVVYRVAVVLGCVQVVSCSRAIVRLVDGGVPIGCLPFTANKRA